MIHLDFRYTPVTNLSYYSKKLNVNLFAKRDDLFEEACGGSKARMLQYILADYESEKYEVVVTAGGPNSNFNRACALMCAKLGLKMHLIEYTDEPEQFSSSVNYYICNLVGIEKTRCLKTCVSQTIAEVMTLYKKRGINAKFVYGGGKSLEGVYAYFEVVKELKEQVSNIDYVFLACGTGTTLAGVCAGMQFFFPNAIVHAISTARTWNDEREILYENGKSIGNYLKEIVDFHNLVFHEEYLCGGYAKYTPELMDTIRECICYEGMIIDPTYSGKAFWGMKRIIEQNPKIYKGKTVCFLNTGGIFNLLSTKDV